MDPAIILDMANQVIKLKMFPYFDMAHAALACMAVRDDLGSDGVSFSRKHPLACWVSSMMAIFAGSIFSSLLLGEPVMGVFSSPDSLLLATGVWYVMFYSPFDLGYSLAKFLPVKIVLSSMKEVQRAKKIFDGVTHAAHLYPNAYVTMAIIGTIKGNGAGLFKIFERLLRGVWQPSSLELLTPSFQSKSSLLAALVFIVDQKTQLISAPHALVYLGIVTFFVYFKLSSLLLGVHDPIAPLENIAAFLLFGGIWDSIQTLLTTTSAQAVTAKPSGGKKQQVVTSASPSGDGKKQKPMVVDEEPKEKKEKAKSKKQKKQD